MPYSKISEVPSQLKAVAPVMGGKSIKLTLAQANKLAEIYDAIKNDTNVKNPMEASRTRFREIYIVKGGKWMKKKNEVLLNEVWAKVPGSYEEDIQTIRDALRKSSAFGDTDHEWSVLLEATYPDYIIVENPRDHPPAYYKSTWKKNDAGGIEFSDVEEVSFELVAKVVNEQKELIEKVRKETGTVDLNEVILTAITLNEETTEQGKRYKGKVDVAQRAGITNGNNREYKPEALREAVKDLQQRIEDSGPRLMDYDHRVKDGKNERNLRETVALINEVGWNEADQSVSLNDITFVDTQAGNDIIALMEGGAQLQVSQRAVGTSEIVRNENDEIKEIVNSLVIDGWDFVPPGEASIKEATFQVLTENANLEGTQQMNEKLLTEQDVQGMLAGFETKILDVITSKLEPEETIGDKEKEKVDTETPAPADNNFLAEISQLKTQVDESSERIASFTLKEELDTLRQVGKEFLVNEIDKEDYNRFNDEEKKTILESIDPTAIHGTVDLSDEKVVNEALLPLLTEEITKVDKYMAAAKLKSSGYPVRGEGGEGIAHVEVLNENIPGMEYIAKVTAMAEQKMALRDEWVMPKDHSAMVHLNEVLAQFDQANYQQLLNEANEEVTQSDIGGRIATIARAIIAIAWRRITAFNVVDLGPPMTNRIEDIKIAQWNPAETAEVSDDVSSIMVAESGTYPTTGIQYTSFPLYAVKLAVRSFITPEAVATARNTPMMPVSDTVAGLALDVQHRVDRLLWQLQITAAQQYTGSYTEVTTAKNMVDLGSDVWAFTADDTTAIAGGVLKYEWVKSVDAEGNPTGVELKKLFGTVTGNSLQEVVVTVEGGADLTYTTDYTINWIDGTITLTAAGVTAEGGNGLEAQLTYNTGNTKFWSVTPPGVVTLYDHLINLRQQVGAAKVLIGNRHYNPNFLGASLEMEDLISSGPQFTSAGSTPAETMDRLASVLNYAGLEPTKTSAIPNGYILIGEKGAAAYRVQRPWQVRGPITENTTGNDYYLAEEFSAEDVPVKEKLALVLVTDLS
ncbi:MAG: hypothetical protein ACYS1A_08180 [Planctomycetota bacterium]|jgi:hypothetical protein